MVLPKVLVVQKALTLLATAPLLVHQLLAVMVVMVVLLAAVVAVATMVAVEVTKEFHILVAVVAVPVSLEMELSVIHIVTDKQVTYLIHIAPLMDIYVFIRELIYHILLTIAILALINLLQCSQALMKLNFEAQRVAILVISGLVVMVDIQKVLAL